jgi:hypothetical protein
MLMERWLGNLSAAEMLRLASVCTPDSEISVDMALVEAVEHEVIATGKSVRSRPPLVSATLEVSVSTTVPP